MLKKTIANALIGFSSAMAMAAFAPSALATEYSVIAFSYSTGNVGISNHMPSLQDATDLAVYRCHAEDCQGVTYVVNGQCQAIAASNDNRLVWWAHTESGNEAGAWAAALNECVQGAGGQGCSVRASSCL
ncbi:MAG TPA: DUF4189 domain-containing protein [Oligoflexus sp.]|uniref:DUF4189 domain-containing protein n=1 Tax=Oligoflexus sp. TaxID=1971216 RepID=UPI002D2685C7|nr:DUF4189 domain-containing protein [Oligoflexus sp.]HYX34197.1 DUF4189 domain-containing protein [Oligoflexus sp.]